MNETVEEAEWHGALNGDGDRHSDLSCHLYIVAHR